MTTVATAHPLVYLAMVCAITATIVTVWAWCDERAERRELDEERQRSQARFLAELESYANHPSHRGRP